MSEFVSNFPMQDSSAGAPILTVAICTYDRYDLVHSAIRSALAQSLPNHKYQVFVVDNSTDHAISLAAAARYQDNNNLRWIHERRPGLSNARNVAMSAAVSPFIAFLDDDAIASPEWGAALLRAFNELGDAAVVVGGRVRPAWTCPQPEWLDEQMLAYLSVLDLGPNIRFIEDDEWLVGANICYRTDALRAVGGFNTSLGRSGSGAALMSNDETELARRLQTQGGRGGYAPDAVVDHVIDPHRVTQRWFRRRIAWQAVSEYLENPDRTYAGASRAWTALKAYMATCSPADRTIRALALPCNDPKRFHGQISAIYEAVAALLSGLEDQDEP